MITVVPTVLEQDEAAVQARLQAIGTNFSRAQLDVLNNTFVPYQSFADPDVLERIRENIEFEVDLMVSIDDYNLDQWNRGWVYRIAFHVEATDKVQATIDKIKSWQKKVYLSLNPDTELEAIEPYRKKVDGILFLTVNPGKSGNPYQPQVVERIRDLRDMDKEICIEVDGGVTNETLPFLLDAGVNGVAIGSYFANDKIESRSMEILEVIEEFDRKNRG
jgi:ribulose-phosphate 3-epimerase